jgi:hypothetical protein
MTVKESMEMKCFANTFIESIGLILYPVLKKVKLTLNNRWRPIRIETSRLTHFVNNWLTDGTEVVSLTHWLPFTPQENSW